jgi:hypothetical protein
MKVIDLLNKIAKGEEVPKKIKWNDDVWIYSYGPSKSYYTDYEDLFSVIDGSNLNDEVEIIGEKDIERLEDFEKYPRIPKNEFETELMKYIAIHRVKINELIDIVKELRSKQ